MNKCGSFASLLLALFSFDILLLFSLIVDKDVSFVSSLSLTNSISFRSFLFSSFCFLGKDVSFESFWVFGGCDNVEKGSLPWSIFQSWFVNNFETPFSNECEILLTRGFDCFPS